ncbi:MAG TPA: glycosyltransferase family 39 protein, partial [Bryobacteraceae bacterium]|nr:glycosyltransferase family 39 protein [Bryobacteraceae bacterium]
MTQRPWTFLFSALILLLALFPLAWVALTNSDLPQFGRYQDEGLYVISAKTLYESGEYRIASLPGRPHQTKYQPLFSALLLPVWSGGRAFPDNLQRAAVLSIGVALAFFSVSFGLARALGFSTIAAAVLVACLATSPRLVYWTLLPIADFLFAMLILLTFWILYTKRDAPHWWWVAGGLAAAACLTKVVGALIIPAVLFANWRRKDWRRAVVVTGPAVAATLAWTIWSQQHRAGGENSVLWYYTDYVAFHVRTGGLAALPEFVYRNTFGLVEAVGGFVYYDLPSSITGRAISAALLAGAVSGARRLLRRTGAVEYVTFCVLLTMVLLTWNFNPTCRLLAPAMPLLAMALFEEARHIGGLIRQGMSSAKVGDRVVAHSFAALGVCGWIAAFTLNVQFVVVGIPGLLAIDRAALKDTLPIYEWCKRSLP